MTAMPTIDSLLKEIGPVLDPLSIEAFPQHRCWGLLLDEATSLLIDLDEEAHKLILSHEVGTPAQGDRFRLYELMLLHNHQWDATGGRRLAIDEAGGGVVLLQDVAIQGLDVVRLCAVIEAFAEAARGWRQIVATSLPAPPVSGSSLDPAGRYHTMNV